MLINRVTYVTALLAVALFWTLYPFWISWYLLVLVLLLIPFDLLMSIAGMLTKRISLSMPRILEQGEDGIVVISTRQEKDFPAGYIIVKLLETYDDDTYKQQIKCSPEVDSRYNIKLDTTHCGVIIYDIRRIRNTSLIGLFSVSHKQNQEAAVLVIPVPIKPPNIISLPRGVTMRPKPGGGFSEDSELRLYRTGDPVKSIHWKLSAKLDSLIIREPLEPKPHSRLVHVMVWSGYEERDITLGRLRWISDYLLKRDIAYCVKLGDSGVIAEISNNDDFIDYLYHIMSNTSNEIKTRALSTHQFSWVFRVDAKQEVSA